MSTPFFRFHSLLFPKIWGGKAIAELKQTRYASAKVGESFEVSALPGEETPVEGDNDAGSTLRDLIRKYGAALMGKANLDTYGDEFPLLIKFIDAQEDLSIQVHPDDVMAQREGMPFGKTEMWYVLKAEPDARLFSGFKESTDAEAFSRSVADGTLCSTLRSYATHAGDSFFIPAGTIHSIGAGNLIVEVQQSCGATYRVYDFDRRDKSGHKRELHLAQAKEALHFEPNADGYIPATATRASYTRIKACRYFTLGALLLDKPFLRDYSNIDSFIVLVAYEGSARLTDAAGRSTTLRAGQSILFPADNGSIDFEPQGSFAAVEIYV